MNNKLNIFLLGVIILILAFGHFRSCSQNKKLEEIYQKQIDEKVQLSDQIEQIARSRVDSVWVLERQFKPIIIEKEKKQNEVFNAVNIDSVIKLYYRNRPDKADTTD
ncbi:MAG: hypothetical protein WC879_03325 [Melioribacteraceae bacterium]